MSGSLPINGLMVVFSITTVAVFLYPIIKLLPSWLERSLGKKIAFHRDAIVALGTAIERAHNAPEHLARLQAQRDYHRAALTALAPGDALVETPLRRDIDAAA